MFESVTDLAMLVQCSNQLNYEATDIGNRSIVGSYVPVNQGNAFLYYTIFFAP